MKKGNGKVDDQVKLKKVLDELMKREENRFCADCGARGKNMFKLTVEEKIIVKSYITI